MLSRNLQVESPAVPISAQDGTMARISIGPQSVRDQPADFVSTAGLFSGGSVSRAAG
jgi:hypothetical protein